MSTATNSHNAASAEPDARRRFATLYAEHAESVLAFLIDRLGREDAVDVSQTVWCRAFEKLHLFDGGHFRGWIFTIARNEMINQLRNNQRKPQDLNDMDGASHPADEDDDMSDRMEEHKQALSDCLKKLDPEFRVAVQARLTGASYAEISAQTGTPKNTVMTRYHRATLQLRECVERTLS